jgi:hypothetical protein
MTTQTKHPVISRVTVEDYQPSQNGFIIVYGCDYTSGDTDTQCREMEAPAHDIETFFIDMETGSEGQDLYSYLADAPFYEQLQFFSLYVKNRLEAAQITRLVTGILKGIDAITQSAA